MGEANVFVLGGAEDVPRRKSQVSVEKTKISSDHITSGQIRRGAFEETKC